MPQASSQNGLDEQKSHDAITAANSSRGRSPTYLPSATRRFLAIAGLALSAVSSILVQQRPLLSLYHLEIDECGSPKTGTRSATTGRLRLALYSQETEHLPPLDSVTLIFVSVSSRY